MVLEENYYRIFRRIMFYKICEHAFMSCVGFVDSKGADLDFESLKIQNPS